MNKITLGINGYDLMLGHAIQVITYRAFEIYKDKPLIDDSLIVKWLTELLTNNLFKYTIKLDVKVINILFITATDSFTIKIDLNLIRNRCVSFIEGENVLDNINIFEIIYS